MLRKPSEWKEIAESLKKAGWVWGCTQRVDSNGQTAFVADAQRDEKRFVVRSDSKAAAFVELQRQVRTECPSESAASAVGTVAACVRLGSSGGMTRPNYKLLSGLSVRSQSSTDLR